jgi:hypothetical protein
VFLNVSAFKEPPKYFFFTFRRIPAYEKIYRPRDKEAVGRVIIPGLPISRQKISTIC